MFADFSNSKDMVLLNLQGLENHPELEASLRKYVAEQFPVDKEEMTSINEDTYEVLTGIMTDIIIHCGDEHDYDFAAEDSELDFAVIGVMKIAPSRVILSISFIDNNEEEDGEDQDGEWD